MNTPDRNSRSKRALLKLGITGTDTSVGKTVLASAIVTLLRSRSFSTGVMKPVETGVTRGEAGSDHVQLAVAAGVNPDDADVCPVVYEQPVAPWVAARQQSVVVNLQLLDATYARVCEGRDCVVVEGAGGLLVPITRTLRYDNLFARWELELIIVAADKLGALNHTLLTIEAAQRAGLHVRGVVLNQLHPVSPMPPGADNATALRELIPEIPVVAFPCIEGLHGGKLLHEYGAPLDLQLLRDVALETGLANLLGLAV